jgi:DNA-binding winged helix-turn-helix (wHTH) protein/TolB-like protein
MPSTLQSLVRFADFEVDLRAGELRREGSRVRLQEQPFLLLAVLLESAGEVVTREELRKRLWSADTFVDFDHRLAVAVSKLRDALRDSAENPKFVETVGRRGYRFLGQLEFTDTLSADSGGRTSDTPLSSHQPAEQAELPKLARPQPRRSRSNRLIFLCTVGLGFGILLAVTAVTTLVHIRSGKKQSLTPRSLAILPLQNRGEDSRSDFLGLSLADVLITKLAYVSSLSVRPSAAIEKYRGTAIDLQKVAADLEVDTLLTGSFIRDGNNLRITYQLVDAKTEKILGQGVIDLKYDNLLAVQDKVTSQLISEQVSPCDQDVRQNHGDRS